MNLFLHFHFFRRSWDSLLQRLGDQEDSSIHRVVEGGMSAEMLSDVGL